MKILDTLKNRALWLGVCATTAAYSFAQETGGEVDVADAMDQVKEQFTGLISDAVPVIIGLIGAAIGIFAIFAAVKWLKKALNSGSK